MIRRAYIATALAQGLMLTTATGLPSYCRLAASARNFQFYFRDLKQGAGPLSPVERFVFSLVLANTKPAPPDMEGVAPERHT